MRNPILWLSQEALFAHPKPASSSGKIKRRALFSFSYLSVERTSAISTQKPNEEGGGEEDHRANERILRGSHTIEAPSPRTALSAKSGTGNHDGRPMTCPKCSHISASRTGFGAVPLITPVMS